MGGRAAGRRRREEQEEEQVHERLQLALDNWDVQVPKAHPNVSARPPPPSPPLPPPTPPQPSSPILAGQEKSLISMSRT